MGILFIAMPPPTCNNPVHPGNPDYARDKNNIHGPGVLRSSIRIAGIRAASVFCYSVWISSSLTSIFVIGNPNSCLTKILRK